MADCLHLAAPGCADSPPQPPRPRGVGRAAPAPWPVSDAGPGHRPAPPRPRPGAPAPPPQAPARPPPAPGAFGLRAGPGSTVAAPLQPPLLSLQPGQGVRRAGEGQQGSVGSGTRRPSVAPWGRRRPDRGRGACSPCAAAFRPGWGAPPPRGGAAVAPAVPVWGGKGARTAQPGRGRRLTPSGAGGPCCRLCAPAFLPFSPRPFFPPGILLPSLLL